MKLNLTQAQIRKARSGKPFQVKLEQMGSGMDFNFHPTNLKKLNKAHSLGKGVRLTLTGGELGDMDGGKLSLNKVLKKVGVKKLVNKNITEKNVKKYALKGYNRINNELEKQGMSSIHQAVLNEGLNYVPFVPSSAKTVASHYATKYADKALKNQSVKVGAGVNPYIPTGLLGSGIKGKIPTSRVKVYDDLNGNLRPNQAGFKSLSNQEAQRMTSGKPIRGGSFKNSPTGGSFKN